LKHNGAGGYLERSPMLSHESQRAANEVNVKTERNTDKIAQSNAEILRLQQRAATEKDVEQNQERREAA